MNTKSIYEAVVRANPCSHDSFLGHLDLTVRTLIAQYSMPYVVVKGESYGVPRSINNDIPIAEEYFPAIVDNVLFLATGNIEYKSSYISNAEAAYKSVWKAKARGRKILDGGYMNV